MANSNIKEKLLYKDLSYEITGLAFKIDNQIGYGQTEKIYCNALEKLFINENIPYIREFYAPIKIDDEVIAKRYFDFLIDDKIILEVKVGYLNYRQVCSQVYQYLKASKHKLGLVVRFNKNGVFIKRIPNLKS